MDGQKRCRSPGGIKSEIIGGGEPTQPHWQEMSGKTFSRCPAVAKTGGRTGSIAHGLHLSGSTV